VPVLVHEGHPIYESLDQMQYIENTFAGESLTPPHLKDEIAKWMDKNSLTGVDPANTPEANAALAARLGCAVPALTMPLFATMVAEDISYGDILWGLRHHPNKERPILFMVLKLMGARAFYYLPPILNWIRRSRQAMKKHLQDLNETLSDGRLWLLGETFTLADVGLTVILHRLVRAHWTVLWADLPHVVKYWQRVNLRPSFQKAIVDAELPIVRDGSERLEKWKNDMPWFRELLECEKGEKIAPSPSL